MESVDLDVLSAAERPWFSARSGPAGVVTAGTARCLLGHRIDTARPGVPDGIFVEWDWDGERLQVTNDRYGIYPLYYACHGGEIRISPAIQHVLKGEFPKSLNYPGLAVFFRLGFFIGEDTPFEHIQVLPPASRLIWREGEMTLERGPIGSRLPATLAKNFDEAVDQYAELFRQAIRRRAPDGNAFAVPISGGRDSRHILFELLEQGHRPTQTLTVRSSPPSRNEDIRIARILAESFELPHTEIDIPKSFFRASMKDIELTDLVGSGHGWILPVSAFIKNSGEKTLYDGLAGGSLSAGQQGSEEKRLLFRHGTLTALALRLLHENKTATDNRTLLKPRFSQLTAESVAAERLVAELKRHQNEPEPLLSWVFWNRTRRSISQIPFAIFSHVPNVYCPYLDHDLFDFLMHVDASYALSRGFHDETIRRAYPRYSHLPFEDKSVQKMKDSTFSAYHQRAVLEFAQYMVARPRTLRSGLIRTKGIWPRIARDLVRSRNDAAWYLWPALYGLELERASRGEWGH